jgi:ketosteroid isomerase-like protein
MKPEDIHRLFQKYFTEQDLEGLGRLYDENAMFIPGSRRSPIIGRDNIKNELKPYFESVGTICNISRSIYENGDIALIKSVWKYKSEKGQVEEGTAIEVLKKTNEGRWVFIIDNPYGV